MAPRVTAKQAIELLKIHQLRKENAAIYQQIQHLRGEVSDVRVAGDKTSSELERLQVDSKRTQSMAALTETSLNKIQSRITSLEENKNSLQLSLLSGQNICDQKSNAVRSEFTLLVNKVSEIENQNRALEKSHGDFQLMLTEELDKSKAMIVMIADEGRLELLKRHLDGVQNDMELIQATSFPDSTREYHFSKNQEPSTTKRAVPDSNAATQSLILPHKLRQASTLPDDLDLDGDTRTTVDMSCRTEDITPIRCDPMSTSHSKRIVEDHDIVLTTWRFPDESLAVYLKRMSEIIDESPNNSEHTFVHLVLENLVKKLPQNTPLRRSQTTSKPHLKDALCLPDSSLSTRSDILVPATEPSELEARNGNQRSLLSNAVQAIPKLRRSQRLAYKSHKNTQGPSNSNKKTESQADIFDGRVAKAAQRKKQRKPPPKTPVVRSKAEPKKMVNFVKRFNNQDCVATHQNMKKRGDKAGNDTTNLHAATTAAAAAVENVSHFTPISRVYTMEAFTDMDKKQTKKRYNRRDRREGSTGRAPQTPSKQIFGHPDCEDWSHHRPYTSREIQESDGLHEIRSHKIDLAHVKAVPAEPSPYMPIPQLVSRNRRISMGRQDLNLNSGDLLPTSSGQGRQALRTIDHELGGPRKKRRLPLPPPPEIPILSTSTEDGRFDRW